MKIIEDNSNSFTTKCLNCRSMLGLEISDIKGDNVCLLHFHCMACNKNSNLPLTQVPRNILEKLDERFEGGLQSPYH